MTKTHPWTSGFLLIFRPGRPWQLHFDLVAKLLSHNTTPTTAYAFLRVFSASETLKNIYLKISWKNVQFLLQFEIKLTSLPWRVDILTIRRSICADFHFEFVLSAIVENLIWKMMENSVAANVEFDKRDRVYMAGETLKGILYVDCLIEVSTLSISLNGETKVSWHDTIGKHSDYQIHLCTSQDFLRIFKKAKKEKEKVTKVAFKFELPEDLPSSIESNFGFTRFRCIVQIEAQQSFTAPKPLDTFEFPFTILAKISGKKRSKVSVV